MSAQIIDLPTRGHQADEVIRVTVKGLMKGKELNSETVAPKMGLSPATLYRKLQPRNAVPFKAGEVAELAQILGVSVGQLYDGLGGTFTPPDPAVDGQTGGRRHELPGPDSNREPCGSPFDLARVIPFPTTAAA